MKELKNKVFQDSDFPDYLFIAEDTGQPKLYKLIKPHCHRQRDLYHFEIKDNNGKRRAISESRIETSLKKQQPILDSIYCKKKDTFRFQSKLFIEELMMTKNDLISDYPRLQQFFDDAITKILQRPIPKHCDLRRLIIKEAISEQISYNKKRQTINGKII